MLNLTTALGRNGLQDWIIQRVSAIILAGYTIFLLGLWLTCPLDENILWSNVFDNIWVSYATVLSLLVFLAHAWIGMWTVFTDYLKSPLLRLVSLVLVYCILLFYFIWTLQILWS
jgi:succinate dehydrogenase / fumarate reductase membrane anchor subunit